MLNKFKLVLATSLLCQQGVKGFSSSAIFPSSCTRVITTTQNSRNFRFHSNRHTMHTYRKMQLSKSRSRNMNIPLYLNLQSDPNSNSDSNSSEIDKQVEMEVEVEVEVEATIKQKIEVCLYRLTLISASVACASGQLSKVLLVAGGGSGLPADSIAALEYNSHAILSWGILFASLLAPPNLGAITDETKENEVNNALFLLLNELLPQLASFAILVEVVNTIQSNLSQGTAEFVSATSDTLDSTTNIFISLICLREIGFFGAGYKVEAILAILFSVGLGLNDLIGLSEAALNGGLALCLLVLSFGKVFEPIEDDLRPNQSAFFKNGGL